MTCAKCGAANQGGARFCGVCGAASAGTEPASSPSLGEAPAMIGREIAGRYRMLAKLGEGGMGTVFRAEQISLKRTVAVKLLRPDVVTSPLLLRRFNAEAEAVAKLSHPNTVNIYDFGQDADGTLFIAMEYIDGRSLRSVIHQEAPLAPRRALAIAHQIAASLADAHAHAIVHRDLKPDNVMLQQRGRTHDVARVLDFGIAKLRDDTRATQMQMTQQGDMLGTPQYMAPEQIRAEPIDGRTDIYALGCLLYEMVTARLPHEAPTVMGILSKHLLEHPVAPSLRRPELALPPALDALILGAMAKDPAARPQTMDIVGEQISALLAALPPDRPQGPVTGPAAVAATAAPSHAGGWPGPATGPARFDTPPAHSAYGPPGAPPSGYGPPGAPPRGHGPPGAQLPGPPSGYGPPGAQAPGHGPPGAQPPGPPSGYGPPPGTQPSGYGQPGNPGTGPAPLGARPAGHRRAIAVVAGVVVAAGAAIAAVVVLRAPAVRPAPGDAAIHDVPVLPAPTPERAKPDPWGASDKGTKIGVGEGVSLVLAPQFQATMNGDVLVAADDQGILVFAGPIAVASSDPMELARFHVKGYNLAFDGMVPIQAGGASRPMLRFHGKIKGTEVRQFLLPLIGPGYRIAVGFQAPLKPFDADKGMQAMVFDLFTQRIVLP